MSLRVVNLGLPKSGTTTLARALKLAGLKVADHRIRVRQTQNKTLHRQYVGDLLYRGYFETGDPAAYLEEFPAISEMSVLRDGQSLWPQTDAALIAAIRAHHPGVKFLASRRDPFEMSQSILGWSDLGTERLPAANVPGLPVGYGETSKERETWITGHYAHLAMLFRDDPDFLEFDVADKSARNHIADFLGLKLPWWGRINVNPTVREDEVPI
ncbi:sulfotransferase family protein [Thalassococcus sp. S3]|uniref:sulfotransferase family protein n=1 Tax=Thalassococcus sp. S3 TaxID=2017482 RepID=UPI001024261C|nr:sulfotransferase family protein [Thalassococcus sp. S3]QBF31403.1 sulfotransferase family protein [Thalassococcus sp. S3]